MSNTLTLQRDVAASKTAAILLATGATLACFALFGLTRNFVFPTSSVNEPGIHPRAEIPQPTEVEPLIEIPLPTSSDSAIIEWSPAQGNFVHGYNRDIPGCGSVVDGDMVELHCWGGAEPIVSVQTQYRLLVLITKEDIQSFGGFWINDDTGASHPFPESVNSTSTNHGFRTGSGLRKDK